jgi:chromosome segregation ATPase
VSVFDIPPPAMNTDSNAAADAPVDSTADASAPAQPKTLAEARAALKQSAADLEAAKTALADAKAENQRIAEQFNEATAAADKAKSELAEMTAARDTALSEKSNLATQLADEKANTDRLEKLMKLKGVSPTAAVPLIEEVEEEHKAKTLPLEKFNALEPAARMAFIRDGGKIQS